MVYRQPKWIVKEKHVFNVDMGRVESLICLRMDTIDHYNNTMGRVDISDQLRNKYRFDH